MTVAVPFMPRAARPTRFAQQFAARSLLVISITVALTAAGGASAEDGAKWLERAAQAARTLNYAGTIV